MATGWCMYLAVVGKGLILVSQSQSDRAENSCERPKLSKARDNIDHLCKDVNLSDVLDSQVRDK